MMIKVYLLKGPRLIFIIKHDLVWYPLCGARKHPWDALVFPLRYFGKYHQLCEELQCPKDHYV